MGGRGEAKQHVLSALTPVSLAGHRHENKQHFQHECDSSSSPAPRSLASELPTATPLRAANDKPPSLDFSLPKRDFPTAVFCVTSRDAWDVPGFCGLTILLGDA